MPNRDEHNRECKIGGIESEICDLVNRWMDAPSQEKPGCAHRNSRHSSNDCDEIAKMIFQHYDKKGYDIAAKKAQEAREACNLHRDADKREESCGCRALFE